MTVSPQMQEKRLKQRRFIIVTSALVFSAAWAIIGILSILNIIQTTWSGISSAIFAFLGVVVAVSQWLFPFPPLKESNNSLPDVGTQLKLVEVSVTEEPRIEDDPPPPRLELRSEVMTFQLEKGQPRLRRLVKLEFKLRNVGTYVGFLKRADFRILDIATFLEPPPRVHYARVPISEDYYVAPDNFLPEPKLNDSLLEPALKGRNITVNLSQSVAPNEVDRFTITIGNQGYPDRPPIWYLLKVNLIYDETNEFLETEPILLSIPPYPTPLPVFRFPDPYWEIFEMYAYPPNQEIARKFLQIEAIRSPSVEFVRQHYLDKDDCLLL